MNFRQFLVIIASLTPSNLAFTSLPRRSLPRGTFRRPASATPFIENVLLVQCGFGNDSHGQNVTKAAVRACRNAIEFNSIRITKIIPGGYHAMKVNVILGVPVKYQDTLDLDILASSRGLFPFGETRFEVRDGGLVAPSGRAIAELGDRNDDMLLVAAAVQVGY